MKFHFPILSCLVLSFSLIGTFPTRAAEEKKPAPPAPPLQPVAVVPYNPDKPVDDQSPARYYIDYPTFQAMWDKVKNHRMAQNSEAEAGANAPKDHTLSAALYRIRSSSKLLTVEGQISITTRGGQWQKVPLPFSGINLSRITLNGEPASYRDGAVLIEETGSHLLGVEFQIPLDEKSESATWKIPPASGTLLEIAMDSDVAEPVLQKAWPLAKTRDADGKLYYTAAIGQETTIEFRRRLKTSGRGMTRPNLAVVDARLFIAQGLERLEADYRLEFEGQEENRFTISFDASLTPVQFEIPNLSSWELGETTGNLRNLTFTLSQPVQDYVSAKMIAERIVGEDAAGERTFPALSAEASRVEQRRSLLRVRDLSIKTQSGSRHRQIPFPGNADSQSGFEPVSSFSLMGENEDLRYEASPKEAERSALVSYVYQVGSGKLETIARFKIQSPEAPLLHNAFSIPAESKIQLVSGNRIRDWWRTGDELFIRYQGGTPETTEVIIYITQQVDEAAGDTIAIAPVGIDGISDDKVTGSGLVVGHVTRDIVMKLDQSRQTIREVGATEVLGDSEILPPLERKRGFKFEKATFSGSIALSEISPKYNALWVMLAQVHESWTRLSIHTDIEVTQSGVDRFQFETPESMPQLRVISDEVRELRHELVDGVRNYEVVFQRFVTDSISFTLETELPHSGESSLPDLDIPDATRQERFVIVENQSTARMNLRESGLQKTVSSQLPFKPQSLISAQLFRAKPGWSLTANLEELETSAGNDAVILYAELTSSFRANGEEWLKAVYHIQNRSLQFLPVRLQENAELVSVIVDGVEVRADQGDSDAGTTILVPLIQTKPGQLAYDVELVIRSRDRITRGGKLPVKLNRTLNDPDVPGTTIEKTMWNVFLPQGHIMKEVEGNMDQVEGGENLYRKLQADLQELKMINSVGADTDNGLATRQFSVFNGEVLVDRIEDKLQQLDQSGHQRSRDILSSASNPPVGQVRRELEEQKNLIASNRGQIAAESTRTETQAGHGFQAQQGGKINLDVQWGVNSADFKKRGLQEEKQVQDQLKRVESQVRLNDNISIAGGTETQVLERDKSGKSDYSSLQKLEESPGSGKVDEKLNALNFSQNGALMDLQQQADQMPQIQTKREEPQKKKAAASKQANDFGNIDNARSSVSAGRKLNIVPQANPGNAPSAPPMNAPADPFAAPVQQDREAGVGVQVGYASDYAFATSGLQNDALRAQGRRSVNVEFPTEGQAHYFQKLKDHAELQIESALPGESKKGPWLILLLVCLALLWGGKKLADRWGQHRTPA